MSSSFKLQLETSSSRSASEELMHCTFIRQLEVLAPQPTSTQLRFYLPYCPGVANRRCPSRRRRCHGAVPWPRVGRWPRLLQQRRHESGSDQATSESFLYGRPRPRRQHEISGTGTPETTMKLEERCRSPAGVEA